MAPVLVVGTAAGTALGGCENDWLFLTSWSADPRSKVDTMRPATCGASERPAVDPDRFRTLMRRFATGVTIVTCPGPDGPEGITVSAFTSVSLHPPQVLVCLDRRSRTLGSILTAGRFAVNVLGWEQRDLATRLADKTRTPAQRLAGIRESTLVTGSPVVPDSLAVIDCVLAQEWPCGDHMLLVGDVVGGSAERVDEPLLLYEGGFRRSATSRTGTCPRTQPGSGDSPGDRR